MQKRVLILFVVFLFGLSGSLFFAWSMQQIGIISSQKQFIKDASSYAHAIEMGLQFKFNELKAVKGLFDASERVDKDEFDRFVGEIVGDKNNVVAIQWLPRQVGMEPSEASQEDQPTFAFIVPAGSLEEKVVERYPVKYSFPSVEMVYAMAPDELISEQLTKAIQQVRDEGVSKVIVHTHRDDNYNDDDTHPYDMDILLPVYQSETKNSTVEERRKNFMGLVRSRSELWFVIENFIQSIFAHPGGIDLFIFGEVDQMDRGMIYQHFSRIREKYGNPNIPSEMVLNEQFHFAKEMEIGNQQWRLVMRPADLMAYSGFQEWYPIAALMVGMFVTMMATLYLHIFLRNSSRIKLLAEETIAAFQKSQEHFLQFTECEQRYRSVT
ncbi:MAG: CHASE domain-containing protein, partial [Magnetococcales bacterium]|nr:CHASE domain-containing protein [Magnetococcales bacterium]